MFKEIKENWLILVLTLSFLLVKLFFLLKPHLVGWDEAVYLGMGKYIWSWGQVGLWENIRPMGLPLLLGFFWKINLNYFFWAEVLINLFAVGNLILVYFIGKELYHKYLGFTAALILAITPIFFSQSSLIMPIIPATFFALAAVYFYLSRKSFVWVGLFAALAFLFRFTQGLLMLVFLFMILFKEKEKLRKMMKLSAGFFILLMPFLILNLFLYHQQTTNFFDAALQPIMLGGMHQANSLHAQNWFFYMAELAKENYLLVFSLGGLVFFIKNLKRNRRWLIVFLSGLIYLSYFSSIVNKQLRFALDFLPYFCLLAALGFYEFYNLIKRKEAVKYLAFLMMVSFLIFSAKPIFEENYKDYKWRSEAEHPLVEVYTYPNNFEEIILTATPIPAAYTNKLFIPFYDNPLAALKIYEQEKNRVNYIVYFEQFYPCFEENCFNLKKALFDLVRQENKLFEQKSLSGQDFYFFKTI